ncbi:hypothetical protein ACFX11_025482 [Malus domestica]
MSSSRALLQCGSQPPPNNSRPFSPQDPQILQTLKAHSFQDPLSTLRLRSFSPLAVILHTDAAISASFFFFFFPISPSPTSSSSVASPASSTYSKQSLIEVATTISEGKSEGAAEILARMIATQVPDPRLNSEQRLLEFLGLALKSRVSAIDNSPPANELFGQEHSGSIQLLYELSPCFKLGFMAANLAILEETFLEPSNPKSLDTYGTSNR